MKPEIYEVNYEDFVKDPKAFIADLMNKLQLKPSELVDDFMTNRVTIRNTKPTEDRKSYFTDEQKKKILDIVADKAVV